MSEPADPCSVIAGRKARPKRAKTVAGCLGLQPWAVDLARRAAGFSQPGIYPVALIVHQDGRRQLVVNQKVEDLGQSEVKP
jgi:hypothetical protein